MDLCYPVPDLAPGEIHESTLTVRRSRFLTQTVRASTTAEARVFIDRMRSLHADATHNCWAFVAGPPGSTAQIGASDDGEPHGTAGRPMLQVLLHCGAGEICVVVTRWFGGVKLGTGGLVRAYQDCVLENLKTLPLKEKVPEIPLLVECPYSDVDRVRRLLGRSKARILGEEWEQGLQISFSLALSKRESFLAELASVTDGRAECVELDDIQPQP